MSVVVNFLISVVTLTLGVTLLTLFEKDKNKNMLKDMKFNDRMFRAVVDDRKTVTRRRDKKEIYPGEFFSAVNVTTGERLLMRCTYVYEQPLSDMTDRDAVEEGFEALCDFKQEISDIYGQDYVAEDPKMWVYRFKKA